MKNSFIKLRPLDYSDKRVLAELANNKNISDNLRDRFPSPYTLNDAEMFIEQCDQEKPLMTFAIEYKGQLAGVIGFDRQKDIHSFSAEIGYWVGEKYWNKGIATEAVNLALDFVFDKTDILRIFASVFEFNKASQRVLEKAGFKLDCILENSTKKNGVFINEYRYNKLKKIKSRFDDL